jgi:hypothetical protein
MAVIRRLALALVLVAAAVPVTADVVFPARLDVVETAPGSYDVTFTLPFVEGRVLRAEPSMPPTCRDATPRERTATSNGVTTTWTAVCEPASLAGEAILVEGLLGTQTDIAFTLTTLDGRVFNQILRPSRPGFLVPHPPTLVELAAGGGLAGMQWVLRLAAVWLLWLVVGLSGARGRELAVAAIAFGAGAFVALWFAGRGWLAVAIPVREASILLTTLVPAVRLAGGGSPWAGWIRPVWPIAWFLGALCGGAAPDVVPLDGLSHGEQLVALGFVAVGAAAGVALIAAVAVELRAVIVSVGSGRWNERLVRLAGTGLGALAAGLLMANVVALGILARGFPSEPFALVLAAAAMGPLLVWSGVGGGWTALGFAAAASVGLWAGLARIAPPFEGLPAAALLLALGTAVVVGRPLAARWVVPLCVATTAVCSWSATHALVENVSRSTGASVAAVLLATGMAWASRTVARDLPVSPVPGGVRAVGGIVAVWAVAGRLLDYRMWWEDVVATDASLGLLRLPVLTLALLTVAAMLWPRRRRVLDELGVRRRSTGVHWLVLAVAFLVVPYGTVTVRRPFHEPHAPRDDDARRVAEAVLSDTYHAFNLTDEGELYDRLAASVTGELVDDLYLDSRRRLTAGTRQGAEVTVRDVEVLDIGEPIEAGSGAIDYECRWVVTSRVRHLQHIHHRRNIYAGTLTLTVDGGRWKIARVDLTSEDRVVIPGQAT